MTIGNIAHKSASLAVLLAVFSGNALGAIESSGSAICSKVAANSVEVLKSGDGPGTLFENTVSLAAFEGDVDELARQFKKARQRHSDTYVERWLDTALHDAVYAGNKKAVIYLLDQGAQINKRASYMQMLLSEINHDSKQPYLKPGGTPLANAVTCMRPRIADILLKRGADMYDPQTGYHPAFPGDTVYVAITTGSEPLVNVFLKHGLDPCKVTGGPYSLRKVAAKAGLSQAMQNRLECRRTSGAIDASAESTD